jgi:hypothetical protein
LELCNRRFIIGLQQLAMWKEAKTSSSMSAIGTPESNANGRNDGVLLTGSLFSIKRRLLLRAAVRRSSRDRPVLGRKQPFAGVRKRTMFGRASMAKRQGVPGPTQALTKPPVHTPP